jgi:hypothetical protein
MARAIREAGKNICDQAQAGQKQPRGNQPQPKRHSWNKHDDYHKTCRDCGLKALARPHPYERRWYQEYTTTDGRCFIADRVPPCQPARSQPAAAAKRARHAGELDRAAGRAWRQGDLALAARLIADARALDPDSARLWDRREAAIAAAAPRPRHDTQPKPGTPRRACAAPHPHQNAYLAARRSMEVHGTGRCQEGHPVTDLGQDIATRLAAAGYKTSSPELAEIRAWNHAARQRAATADAEADTEAGQ